MSYQYHQLLKYLYFEGYANSYEEAEYLLEELNDYEFYELYENVFRSRDTGAVNADADEMAAQMHRTVADASHTSPENRRSHRDAAAQHLVSARRKRRKAKTNEEYVYENVSGGRARRASSRRAPISQRPTNSDVISANNMGSLSRSNPAKPQDKGDARNSDYIGGAEGVRARLERERSAAAQERQRQQDAWDATRHGRGSDDLWKGEEYYRKHRMVPSRGIGHLEQSLRRGRTDDRGITRPTTPQSLAKERLKDLNWLHRNGYGDENTQKQIKRMRTAIRKKDKWGTPEAAKEEYVINYLMVEGYTDNYGSAIAIYESMSEEWLDTILEVKGRGRVLMRSTRDASERGMKITPERKLDLKLAQVERRYPGDGSLEDLENIEQRIEKMRTVKNTPNMRKRVDNVRKITKQYKR